MRRYLPFLVVAVLVLGLVPFLDKAFTIDDPLFLWLAKRVREAPGDPFGFMVNWSERPLPMHGVTKNPPGMGYYLAGAASIVGWSERALHAAVAIPAAAAALATFALARRLQAEPLPATAMAVLSPVFLVSATTVMADVTMLAFWCGAVWCFLAGLDARQSARLWAAGVLILCAALTKYFGIALVPLLGAWVAWRAPRRGVAWAALLLPLIGLLVHELWLHSLYGHSVLLAALAYAGRGAGAEASAPQPFGLARALVGLAFAGGCLPVALALGPWLWTRRVWIVGGALVALAVAHRVLEGRLYTFDLLGVGGWPDAVALQLLAMVCAGVAATATAISALRRRAPEDVLLAVWVLGTLVFAIFLNWTQSARTFLPAAPALGILLARRLAEREGHSRAGPWAAVGACAALAFGVASADARWAGEVRKIAGQLGERFTGPGHRTFAMGHWGLQWYLEAEGVRTLNFRRDRLERGDILIEPGANYAVRAPDARAFEVIALLAHPASGILHTTATGIGAGFHASEGSPLPWAFGTPEPDRYRVWRAKRAYAYPRER